MSVSVFERRLFVVWFGLGLVLLPRIAAAADPLAVDVDLAIWTAVVFLVTLAVLWKFAWGPILTGLARREEAIGANIATAENAAEEARKLTAVYEAKLAGASDEVRKIIEEARRDAEYTAGQIVDKAQTRASEEGKRMLREVETAKESAIKEISDRGADLAVNLAGQIVKRELSAKDHTDLIRRAQADFLGGAPSQN